MCLVVDNDIQEFIQTWAASCLIFFKHAVEVCSFKDEHHLKSLIWKHTITPSKTRGYRKKYETAQSTRTGHKTANSLRNEELILSFSSAHQTVLVQLTLTPSHNQPLYSLTTLICFVCTIWCNDAEFCRNYHHYLLLYMTDNHRPSKQPSVSFDNLQQH